MFVSFSKKPSELIRTNQSYNIRLTPTVTTPPGHSEERNLNFQFYPVAGRTLCQEPIWLTTPGLLPVLSGGREGEREIAVTFLEMGSV